MYKKALLDSLGPLAMPINMHLFGTLSRGFGGGFKGYFAAENLLHGTYKNLAEPFKGQTMARANKGNNSMEIQNNMNTLSGVNKGAEFKGAEYMEKISSADVKFVNDLVDNLPGMQKTAMDARNFFASLVSDSGNGIKKSIPSYASMISEGLGIGNGILNMVKNLQGMSYAANQEARIAAEAASKVAPTETVLGKLLNSDVAKNALPLLGLGSLGVAGAVAAGNVYDKAKDAVKKELSYREMFEEFPELNDMPRTQVDKYWNVLNDFAPKLTTNPLVAGQFISNMASYGMKGVDYNTIGQLAKIQNDVSPDTSLAKGLIQSITNTGFNSAARMMDSSIPMGDAAIGGLV